VFPIHVPALRKRKEDIPQLVRHFIARFARLKHSALSGLQEHHAGCHGAG
jgi:DNA-binding NtrC family response regulator